jgi:hypothetical protein
MGVVSMVMDHRAADDDVGQLTRPMEKNSRCKSYTPSVGRHRSIGGKYDGGGPIISAQLTTLIEKKSRSRSSTP